MEMGKPIRSFLLQQMAQSFGKIQVAILSMAFVVCLSAHSAAQDKWWKSLPKIKMLTSTEQEVLDLLRPATPQKNTFSHGYAMTYKFKEGYLDIGFSGGGCLGSKPGYFYNVDRGKVVYMYAYFYKNISLKKLGIDFDNYVVTTTPGTQGYGRTYEDRENGVSITGESQTASSISISPSEKFDALKCK
jgi:hypothetical protein